ncbi:hypothetical protein MJM83_30865, partial [Salmonella enterica subsp. enterica serovar Montevideo]|nr:hypothetical protein [Salmonella enterica subsp. enterica serovar Montevideo]
QKFGRRNVLNKEAILQGVEPTDFLQAISILNTLKKRRADLADCWKNRITLPDGASLIRPTTSIRINP